MKSYLAISASLALVASLAACDRASAPAANVAASAENATDDAAAVKQAFAAFNADIAAKNQAAIKAHYASDAVMIIPDLAPFEGVEAIMADYQAFAADPASKFVPGAETTMVSTDGDMAIGEVNYQVSYTNPRTKAVETWDRHNLTVYKKQPDGSWKVIRDHNASLPKAS